MKSATCKILICQNHLFQVCWEHFQAQKGNLEFKVSSSSFLALQLTASRTDSNAICLIYKIKT